MSFTLKGTLYFASNRPGSLGNHDIYRSRLVNGKYTKPENLGSQINSKYIEQDPFIAPDESYLLFTSVNRPDSLGQGDIYISKRQPNGSWTRARNLGEKINTSSFDFCPIMSPDDRYFFYASRQDIYWVEAASILAKTSRDR